jgi:hypothetical protein
MDASFTTVKLSLEDVNFELEQEYPCLYAAVAAFLDALLDISLVMASDESTQEAAGITHNSPNCHCHKWLHENCFDLICAEEDLSEILCTYSEFPLQAENNELCWIKNKRKFYWDAYYYFQKKHLQEC